MGNFFQGVGGGGGGGGGWVQMLISIETYRTCDFPGQVLTPYPPPPLDPLMEDSDLMLVGPCSRAAAHID